MLQQKFVAYTRKSWMSEREMRVDFSYYSCIVTLEDSAYSYKDRLMISCFRNPMPTVRWLPLELVDSYIQRPRIKDSETPVLSPAPFKPGIPSLLVIRILKFYFNRNRFHRNIEHMTIDR